MKSDMVTLVIWARKADAPHAEALEHRLSETSGVRYVYVNPTVEMALVEYEPARVDVRQLVAAAACLGCQAEPYWQ